MTGESWSGENPALPDPPATAAFAWTTSACKCALLKNPRFECSTDFMPSPRSARAWAGPYRSAFVFVADFAQLVEAVDE